MTDTTLAVLEKVHHGLGQGSLLEQIDKVFRKQQRINLFEKLGKVDKEDLKKQAKEYRQSHKNERNKSQNNKRKIEESNDIE